MYDTTSEILRSFLMQLKHKVTKTMSILNNTPQEYSGNNVFMQLSFIKNTNSGFI